MHRIHTRYLSSATLSTALLVGLCVACGSSAQPTDDGPEQMMPGDPAQPTGDVVSTETLADGSIRETTSDGYVKTRAPDGTVTVQAPDGTLSVTSPDGTVTTTSPDGTKMVQDPDGTLTTTSPDGTITIRLPDGSTEVTPPGQVDPDPESPGEMPGAGQEIWINRQGRVSGSANAFGIQGDWYAYGDGITTDQSGNPFEDGKYCVHGVATGDSGNWGAGIGLDLNSMSGEKQPYALADRLSGFQLKITGSAPTPLRLHFVSTPDDEVTPFITVNPSTEAVIYDIADAQVPFSWSVDNAGQRVDDVLYSLQLLAPGDDTAGPIDICIEYFEPVFDATARGGGGGTAYINPDGFVTAESNDLGVSGPVYVISDGTSTSQTGVPYMDGQYCVAGTFSGAGDDWGAGIALDLNRPPGQDRAPYDPTGQLAALRLGLSGSSPGQVRVQFVVNEPQEGKQPFVVGQLNSTGVYPLEFAQVPTSWDVADAGLEIADSVVSVQLYLDGAVPGPFEVCIDEIALLAADEVSYSSEPLADPFKGYRTVDPARLSAEYAVWKESRLLDCDDGTACVPRDEEGDCISEGIGYGMLIAVGNDDRETFDKLWSYFQKHRRPSGLMNWTTTPCGPVATGDGAATDGDVDAAMALIQASCKWADGTYGTDADTLVRAIADAAVVDCGGQPVLRPGDDFGGCTETNPSYVAPAYYREFQALTGQTVWNELIAAGYSLLVGNQTRKAGVFSDWSDQSGGLSQGTRSDDFGPDAARVPWRVATDYIWSGEERAVPLLDAFRIAVEAEGGPHRAFIPNSNYRGGSALSAMVADAATAQQYTDAWLLTAVDDDSYFPGTLRLVYMLLAAGEFAPGCN